MLDTDVRVEITDETPVPEFLPAREDCVDDALLTLFAVILREQPHILS